ncbi:MAG: Hsp20/alpha crystallin family protein, partial [Actinobacteria bacterium]|nr:Hsp20/alpha crystallin family protein [Actinomycetota bacterium]
GVRMAGTRRDSFDLFLGVQEDMNKLLRRNLVQPHGAGTPFAEGGRWIPAADIFEREGSLVVEAELPGVDPGDIDVSIDEGTLNIKGERRVEKEVTEDNYYRVERATGAFQRSIRLPSEVDADKVKASYENGLLTVTVPKVMPGKPKRIPIRTETRKEK